MRAARLFSALAILFIMAPGVGAADVILVKDGQAQAVIRVAADVMAADKDVNKLKGPALEAERQRQRLRESVKDLALYLGKISGAKVEIATTPAKDAKLSILIGALAEKAFGPGKIKAPFKQGFRVVVSPKGIGLLGESDLAASYAIYEVLDRLGCRWYMPSDLGEVIPQTKTIALPEMDFSSAPGTSYRGIWYADDAFRRRNRHGGLLLSAGHALEMYISKEDRKKHPEWVGIVGGKPSDVRLKWSSATLADHIANGILARHMTAPEPTYSLSPDDGMDFDESKEDKALDAGDFDPTSQVVSLTDRLMVLCNRIATKVTAKQPDVLFGMLAYAQYIRPPVREKLHPNIVPQIAPIALCRYHSMTDDTAHGAKELRYLVEGWAKASKEISMYCYAYNLAETSAPMPMLKRWSLDIPFVMKNKCKFWQPETLPNFETHMHANYLGCRLAWDSSLKPADIIDEINTRFYGAAAKPMAAYWTFIDDVWTTTPEYSGCGFAYMRFWSPERLKKARQLMNEAIAACKSPIEKQRVALADESLSLFELFMKLRYDQAEGRFDKLASEAATWRKQITALGKKYKDQHCFTNAPWAGDDMVGGRYFGAFYQLTYDDASRIAAKYQLLTAKPLREFRYQADKDKKGESLGWAKADFDDKGWKTTDVCMETWSTIGYHDWFKSMWYRTSVDVPAVPAGKKVHLWLGATDGSAKVFINGKHVPFVDAKNKSSEEFNGYCQPASFDITAAIRPGAANKIAILCTRTFFNELGTGGLIAPVVVYREK